MTTRRAAEGGKDAAAPTRVGQRDAGLSVPPASAVIVVDGRAYAARRVSRHEAMRHDVRRWERWS